MEIQIRHPKLSEYDEVEAIMKQVQQMHVDWRPDIYQYTRTVLPFDVFEQSVKDETIFVAEYCGHVAGILLIMYRHTKGPNLITRNTIFIDSMAVDEKYRGKGIGHAFFGLLKKLKDQKGYDGIDLQVNAKNKAAYQMYSNYGFTEKSINMELF